jgi:hypothetical protein
VVDIRINPSEAAEAHFTNFLRRQSLQKPANPPPCPASPPCLPIVIFQLTSGAPCPNNNTYQIMHPLYYATIMAAYSLSSRTPNGTLLFGTISFNEPTALELVGTSMALVFSGGAGAAWERRTTIALSGFTNLSFAVRVRAGRGALGGPVTVSGYVACRRSHRHGCIFAVTAHPMLAAPLSRETELPIEFNILVIRLHARAASSLIRIAPPCRPFAWACYPLLKNGSIPQSPFQLAPLNYSLTNQSPHRVRPAPNISIFVVAALLMVASLGCVVRRVSGQAARRTLGAPTAAQTPPVEQTVAPPGNYLSATAGFDSATYCIGAAGDSGIQIIVRPNRHGLVTLLDALEASLRTHRVCKASLVSE